MSGSVVWLTGLPRAGKSTLAAALKARLEGRGQPVVLLDSDELRAALLPPPDYSAAGREAFYGTLGQLAALLARQGSLVLVAATAHQRAWRQAARGLAPRFIEVHVATPLDECATPARDPAGLYRSEARAGLPGVGVAYEPPLHPDVVAEGGHDQAAVAKVFGLLDPPTQVRMRRILVAVDFSRHSRATLRFAFDLGRRCDAAVDVLHVVSGPGKAQAAVDAYLGRPMPHAASSELERARLGLRELLKSSSAEEHPASLLVESGDAAAVIVRTAVQTPADLIVLGTRGHRGVAELLLGSVAHKVITCAGCPVITLGDGAVRALSAGT